VVIYPKEISQLETVLSTGDPNVDAEDGHPTANAHLLRASQSYEHTPIFLREDSEQITQDQVMAEKVPIWMNTAAQVAPGNRKMALEDGPDVMNSDEDDATKEEHGEVPTGMYTSEMDPNQGPMKLTSAQVAAQKAAAQTLESLRIPPRSQSPVGGSSDEDEPTGSEWIWSQTKGCMRRNKFFGQKAATDGSKTETTIPPAVESVPAPHKITPVNSDNEDQEDMTEDQKRLLKHGKRRGSKGPKTVTRPTKEQESSHPMGTRRRASRAGGLRPVGGSGQTATCVAIGHPSKTRVVIFFLRGGFHPPEIQRRSMSQRDNRLP
jgi:hypothetical protein